MSTEESSVVVRLLPTDPRDMVPSAVRWAQTVLTAVQAVPAGQLKRPARASLTAVVWVLAAAADYADAIPGDHTAALLAREVGVGARVWQKRTAWLREHGWLAHRAGGMHDGWQLRVPSLSAQPAVPASASPAGPATGSGRELLAVS